MQRQPSTRWRQLLGKRTAPQVMRAPGGLIHAKLTFVRNCLFRTAARISMAIIASMGEICQGFVRIEGRGRVP